MVADAKRYEIETLAAAERQRIGTAAAAECSRLTSVAEGEKARGLAAAEVTKAQGLAQGLAEALAMEKKAEAWRLYSEAAVLQILAPILPEIAKAVAEPLSRVDRITLVNTGGGEVGVSRITAEVAKVISQVPPVVESLTGIKLEQLFEKIRGLREGAPSEGGAPPQPPADAKR